MSNFTLSIKSMLVISLLTCLAGTSPIQAKSKNVDPIVGSWLFNQKTGEMAVYGVAIFTSDGTFTANDSGDLTQSLPPIAPGGALISASAGNWKRKSKNTYELISTNVVLLRGINCSAFQAVDLASPACPVARLKVVSDFIFEKGCLKATSRRVTTFHPVNDLSLSLPIPPPLGPVPPVPSTREWQKLSN